MPDRAFVAFASSDALLAETIREACRSARPAGLEFTAWNMNDVSGQQIGSAVYAWVESADAIVADISEPNHNVTYEIGLALGMAKPLRLIRSESKPWLPVQEVGLLHNVGHDPYATQAALKSILEKGAPTTAPWPLAKKNREAPIYLLQSSEADDLLSRVASGIKKTMKRRFRSFNPREIDRLTASEAVKIAVGSAEWNDRELIAHMFEQRVLRSFPSQVTWRQVWNDITVPTVMNKPAMDFLIDASLMRPRYLIRLFETARQRAVTLHRTRIEEDDYQKALEELGWQVLEDLGRELTDIVPQAEDLLFELTALGVRTSPVALRAAIQKRVADPRDVEAVIDVLIWAGCLGAAGPKGPTYISDCGFRRPFIRALMSDPLKDCVLLHPTLAFLVT